MFSWAAARLQHAGTVHHHGKSVPATQRDCHGLYNFARFTDAAIGPIVGGLLVMHYSVNSFFLLLALLLTGAALIIQRYLSTPPRKLMPFSGSW
jgi:hypothetical protein